MWEPRRLTILWAFTASYRDSYTFTLRYYPGICLEGWGKPRQTLIWIVSLPAGIWIRDFPNTKHQCSPQPSGRDLNSGLPKYKAPVFSSVFWPRFEFGTSQIQSTSVLLSLLAEIWIREFPNTKHQCSPQSSGRDLNSGLPKYKAPVFSSPPRRSVLLNIHQTLYSVESNCGLINQSPSEPFKHYSLLSNPSKGVGCWGNRT
jgi:hypothetical protein